MHIEPGVVTGAKLVLSYATAAGAATYAARQVLASTRLSGVAGFALRSLLATFAVFVFFEVFPKYPVGVSEVHFILGSTIFLIFGFGPAAIGLSAGLLLQGLLFAPADLPQYFMNVTTLLVPLIGVAALARRVIAPDTAYVDLKYGQALALSTAYQGGAVAWVAFWAFYGQGIGAETFVAVGTFAAAYMTVVLIEPLADLAVLAAAKALRGLQGTGLIAPRVYQAA